VVAIRTWLRAVLWALLATLSAPGLAADYTQGVDVSGNTARLWFQSNVSTTWVDVHYQLNGGTQQNVRMSLVGGRYEQPVAVAAGNTLSYSFTYNNGNPAYDTPLFSFTVPNGDPTPTGTVCFYENAGFAGAATCANASSNWVGSTWNDRISSVKVTAGYQLELFENIDFGGRSVLLTADSGNLADRNFNDLASSYRITPVTGLPTTDTPDFGPNVRIFEAGTPAATIQGLFDSAFNAGFRSPTAQFGTQRYTFLFKPGSYGRVWANMGFYTTVAGLGRNPDDVTITGALNVDSGWNLGDEANATQNFWRSAENLALVPEGGTNRWAVSQAAPMRRVHIRGNLTLAPSNQDNGQGYSSGGYLADSRVDGRISSGSQQQWYTRDSSIAGWDGGVWNMVFSGVQGAPAQSYPNPPHTVLATTPVTREKPYLFFEGGKYQVFVPALRTNSSGATWPNTAGTAIPLSRFYVARPGVSAATLNQALAQGLNLFFVPGNYNIDQTLNVTRANTVVFGLGFPTLVPQNGVNAMKVADVDGVNISGLLFDAGPVNSPILLEVGQAGSHVSHAANPISLQDVFFRIGGPIAGKSTTSLVIHADHTLIDHIWAWRGDHGAGIGWGSNTADTGVVVNGHNVLATGLFVEHYQKYNVVWNGQGGRTIFFQNEMPYDPPTQDAWRVGARGYAAYKVADGVTTHEGWGLGSYCFFNANPSLHADRGFEVPDVAGVKLHAVFTVSLGGVGVIDRVVNNSGAPAQGVATIPSVLVNYP
jgi:hypothetical protein